MAGETLTDRGARRRGDLLDAALRVIVREGPAAVSHRTVAAEAGAAHGSVAYYFGSREELIRETLERVAARNIAALEGARDQLEEAATSPAAYAAALTAHVVEQMLDDRDNATAILELHLAAAREPELRDALRGWGRAYAAISQRALRSLGSRDPDADTYAIVTVVNGLLLQQLAAPQAEFAERVLRPTLERLLTTMAGT